MVDRQLTILGGGPAGLALAFYAHRHNLSFRLFEKSPRLGGLCQTFKWGKHRYDSGAHRFHDKDPESSRDIRALLAQELHEVTSGSKVLISGRLIDFPPAPLKLLRSTKPRQLGAVLRDFIAGRWKKRPEVSFSDFAVNRFGLTLANQFLLNYSEKVWGLPADQLSVDVATRRLKGMSLHSLLIELFSPSRRTSHIDGHFLYPRLGYGQLTEAMVSAVPKLNPQTEHEVVAVEHSGDRIRRIRFSNGQDITLSGLVLSTLPITRLVRLLRPALPETVQEAARGLRFRQIRLFYLRLSKTRHSRNASIYIPNSNVCITRVSEPKNRSEMMAPSDETGLLVEVPCSVDSNLFHLSNEALLDRVQRELEGLGLLKRKEVLGWRHHHLADAYPVYSLDYSEKLETISKGLSEFKNLRTLGRNGHFFYSHLHDQMSFARSFISQLELDTPEREANPVEMIH